MSMESPLLLDALAAWSSSHLALRDKSYERIAIANRCKALNALSTYLSSPDRSPEMELASCLIHCAIESIMGDTKQWFGHLVGAYQIIRSITIIDGTENLDLGRLNTTFEDRWLLKNFAYHDIMMSIAENRKPLLIAGEYWNCGDTYADTYFGLASRLMYLLSEISILNVDMTEAGDVSEIEDPFSVTAQRIHLELVNWTCGPTDDMLVNLTETYRNAALIHLFRTIRQNRPQYDTKLTTKIKQQVAEFVRRIQEMPPRCLAESALLFPLFLACGDADD